MKQWAFRLVAGGIIVAGGFWLGTVFFPSPEKVIRNRMLHLAKLCSFTDKEGNISRFGKVSSIMEYFTPDVECTVDAPDLPEEWTSSTRDELKSAILWSRSNLDSMRVQFLDLNVTVAPDKETATVALTARLSLPDEKDFMVHEMKVTLRKVDSNWRISRIQTVKTLAETSLLNPCYAR